MADSGWTGQKRSQHAEPLRSLTVTGDGCHFKPARARIELLQMRAPTSQSLLLALVLVLGQWTNFAHAGKHSALSPAADQTCEFCVYAQGLGASLMALPKLCPPCCTHEVTTATAVCRVTIAAPSYYSARGPPAFFA